MHLWGFLCTLCTVWHVCLCIMYIGVSVCQLHVSVKGAVLLAACYWLTARLERCQGIAVMRSESLDSPAATKKPRRAQRVLPLCMYEWAVFTQPTLFGREWWAAGVVQLLSGLRGGEWWKRTWPRERGRVREGETRWRCFHWEISQILLICVCNCHVHFSELICIVVLVHLCVFCLCSHWEGTGVCKMTCLWLFAQLTVCCFLWGDHEWKWRTLQMSVHLCVSLCMCMKMKPG